MSTVPKCIGNPSMITVDPPTSSMVGPFGDAGPWNGGCGENIIAGDVCYIAADGSIQRALEDQTGTTAAVNDVQTSSLSPAVVSANITAGTFTLGYQGQYTGALAYNASNSTVQTALQALTTVGAGNITVSGSFPAYVFTGASTFAGKELNLIEINSSLIDTGDPVSIPAPIMVMTHTTVGQPIGASGAEQAQSKVMGFALLSQKRGQPITLWHNVIFNYSDGLLTPGQPLYLSGTVPGALDTAPTLTGQKAIARAMDTQRIWVFAISG